MAFCSNCGQELAEGAKFCNKCGAEVNYQNKDMSLQRKISYDGSLHKCPSCGEILPAFATICPGCGCELRGTDASEALKQFHSKMANAKTESEKISLINTFPVPTNKEDIYEFMILASSNFDEVYYVQHKDEVDISDSWLAKIEQCYQKGKLCNLNEEEQVKLSGIYNDVQQRIKNAERSFLISKLNIGVLMSIPAFFIGLLLIALGEGKVQSVGSIFIIIGVILICVFRKNKREKGERVTTNSSKSVSKKDSAKQKKGKGILWVLLNIFTLGIVTIVSGTREK